MPLSIYANRTLYHLVMRLLYKQYFDARYMAVAAEIPEGSSVIGVCAGDCYLYNKYLRKKSVRYLGLDISPQLVKWSQRHGILAREFDLWKDEIPVAEIIVMQASMYQFLPHRETVMRKLLSSARKKVIISEPICNLSSSRNPLIAMCSRHLTIPASTKGPYLNQRFDYTSLSKFFNSFKAFQYSFLIPGGREMVGVFKGQYKSRGIKDVSYPF